MPPGRHNEHAGYISCFAEGEPSKPQVDSRARRQIKTRANTCARASSCVLRGSCINVFRSVSKMRDRRVLWQMLLPQVHVFTFDLLRILLPTFFVRSNSSLL
ncbi:hypothetical protein LSTR_LSTR000924 [Laodelphax striatellus]|uniref:Uncharacterized protein n=1 Tax=Laodelphax striatellus TaxID=195883 RepID=A0A482X108_LAOST|nr:hypothetical protein LSTR_LSTR000924 [Laodelphax striatellus]